ncbi:MAG: ArsR/SmtB family transcription factor [Candidatus Limnocylindria bacterium]
MSNPTSVPRPIPAPLIELIGGRLRLLALPLRIRLVDHLDRQGETNVQGLVDHLDATQQNVSRHLRLLADAAVLERRQDGRVVWYRLRDPAAFGIIEGVGSQVLSALASRAGVELPCGTAETPDSLADSPPT